MLKISLVDGQRERRLIVEGNPLGSSGHHRMAILQINLIQFFLSIGRMVVVTLGEIRCTLSVRAAFDQSAGSFRLRMGCVFDENICQMSLMSWRENDSFQTVRI